MIRLETAMHIDTKLYTDSKQLCTFTKNQRCTLPNDLQLHWLMTIFSYCNTTNTGIMQFMCVDVTPRSISKVRYDIPKPWTAGTNSNDPVILNQQPNGEKLSHMLSLPSGNKGIIHLHCHYMTASSSNQQKQQGIIKNHQRNPTYL